MTSRPAFVKFVAALFLLLGVHMSVLRQWRRSDGALNSATTWERLRARRRNCSLINHVSETGGGQRWLATADSIVRGECECHNPFHRQLNKLIVATCTGKSTTSSMHMYSSHVVSLVMSYYSVKSKRSVQTYIEWMSSFLLNITTPTLVYTNCETLHMNGKADFAEVLMKRTVSVVTELRRGHGFRRKMLFVTFLPHLLRI